MIQQAYEYVTSSLWPFLNVFLSLKPSKTNEIRLGRLEKNELPLEPNFFIAIGVLPVERLVYEFSKASAAN